MKTWKRVIVWKGNTAIGTIATKLSIRNGRYFVHTIIGLAEACPDKHCIILL